MKKLFLVLLALLALHSVSFADDLPSIMRNPLPPLSDAETRLRFIEASLYINRISWTCHVPKGWKVTVNPLSCELWS